MDQEAFRTEKTDADHDRNHDEHECDCGRSLQTLDRDHSTCIPYRISSTVPEKHLLMWNAKKSTLEAEPVGGVLGLFDTQKAACIYYQIQLKQCTLGDSNGIIIYNNTGGVI